MARAPRIRVRVAGESVGQFDLSDDPADHRGILSWHSQKRDKKLREAGSYGYLINAAISPDALRPLPGGPETCVYAEPLMAVRRGRGLSGSLLRPVDEMREDGSSWPLRFFPALMARMESRRNFLMKVGSAFGVLASSAGKSTAEQREVAWLAEVQRAPAATVQGDVGPMEPLLVAPDGNAITSVAGWERKREELRQRWMEFLGPMPAPPPVRMSVLSEDRPEGCRRQLVRYESEAELPVEGYLLRPEPPTTGPQPALVVLHQTSAENIDEVAGVRGPEMQALGLKLARRAKVPFLPVALKSDFWANGRVLKEFGPLRRERPVHMLFSEAQAVRGTGAEQQSFHNAGIGS